MTTLTQRDAQALTYLARRLREATRGAREWDDQGTYAVIAERIGHDLTDVVRVVIGHATDPEARTPGAMRRPFVPKKAEEPGVARPPKADEACQVCGRALHSVDAICKTPTRIRPPKSNNTTTEVARLRALANASATEGEDDE